MRHEPGAVAHIERLNGDRFWIVCECGAKELAPCAEGVVEYLRRHAEPNRNEEHQ